MTNAEIVRALASRREVERIVNATCGKPIADLAQMIYEVLLKMNGKKLSLLYDDNKLGYYIMGVARRQYYSETSEYHKRYRRQPDNRRLCDTR